MVQPPSWALSIAGAIRYFNLRPWQPRKLLSGSVEPLPQRVARLQHQWQNSYMADHERFGKDLAGTLIDAVGLSVRQTWPCADARSALTDVGIELASQNAIIVDFPEIDLTRALTSYEASLVADRLIDLQTRLENADRIREFFLDSLTQLNRVLLDEVLPDAVFAESSNSLCVPLFAYLDVSEFIGKLIGTFLTELTPETDAMSALAFATTAERFWRNMLHVSRVSAEQAAAAPHRIIPPEKSELCPEAQIDTYLADTPFPTFLKTPVPFEIPRNVYPEHAFVAAPSGHGKTQLLQTLIYDFLQDDSPGMFIVDSQGSMLRLIKNIYPDALLITPEDVKLNLFKLGDGYDSNINDLFSYLFSAIDADLTSKQGAALAYILRLMGRIPNPTIHTLLDVLESPKGKYQSHIEQLDGTSQSFFDKQFYGSGMKSTREQVARRLYTILANPLFSKIFSSAETTFDAFKYLQERKIVLLDTSEASLGIAASAVLGRFYIAQILAAAYKRPEHERPLTLLIVDECAAYLDEKTEMILSKARKFGLGSLWATQFLEQIPASTKAAIYGNTSIKLVGPVSHGDASILGREMYTSTEFIRSMRKYDKRGTEFACYVRGQTNTAMKVTVPFLKMEEAAAAAPSPQETADETSSDASRYDDSAPRAHDQHMNELSLRDTSLPPPEATEGTDDDPAEPSEW